MKENNDKHQIVLSREYFDRILEAALSPGSFGQLKPAEVTSIQWHVRKYNSAYRDEKRKERETMEAAYKKHRAHAIALLNGYIGKTVYVRTISMTGIVIPCKLRGTGQYKCAVVVEAPPTTRHPASRRPPISKSAPKDKHLISCPASNVQLEPPAGYLFHDKLGIYFDPAYPPPRFFHWG